jgi:hypothetical protein
MPTRFKAALRAVARTVLIAWCSAVFWALAPLHEREGVHQSGLGFLLACRLGGGGTRPGSGFRRSPPEHPACS